MKQKPTNAVLRKLVSEARVKETSLDGNEVMLPNENWLHDHSLVQSPPLEIKGQHIRFGTLNSKIFDKPSSSAESMIANLMFLLYLDSSLDKTPVRPLHR